jgi:hypothetical protein
MKNVYLAAPSEAEHDFNSKLRDELEGLGISVFLSQEHSNDTLCTGKAGGYIQQEPGCN